MSFIWLQTIEVLNSNISHWQDRRGHDLRRYARGMLLYGYLMFNFLLLPRAQLECKWIFFLAKELTLSLTNKNVLIDILVHSCSVHKQ